MEQLLGRFRRMSWCLRAAPGGGLTGITYVGVNSNEGPSAVI